VVYIKTKTLRNQLKVIYFFNFKDILVKARPIEFYIPEKKTYKSYHCYNEKEIHFFKHKLFAPIQKMV